MISTTHTPLHDLRTVSRMHEQMRSDQLTALRAAGDGPDAILEELGYISPQPTSTAPCGR